VRVKVSDEVRQYVRDAQAAQSQSISEAHLAPLPEPVQRYLRYAQVLGKPRIRCAKVRQRGQMRPGPTQPWMPVEAVQYTTLAGRPSRTWYARIKVGPLALLSGYDRYDNGTGAMLIRALSIFPVVNVTGPETDMSALIIFVNDMVMWPTAFLSDYIRWEPIDKMSARANVSLQGRSFSAELRFNDIGELVDFVTEDRYRAVGKGFERNRWSTPLRAYREANGFRIPTEGDAIWDLPQGQLPYIHLSIGEVFYDDFDFD